MADQPLFDVSEAFDGDPVRPDIGAPTPLELVLRLSRRDREARVRHLVNQAHDIHDEARSLAGDRAIVADCVLFSGGNDSTVLAHLFRGKATHAVHANTTIGVEETRQFVRDVCAEWGLPLIERTPETSYRELVLDRGFPGPPMHFKMYQRLKERALVQVRRELITNSRRERVVFIAGRRRAESARRADIPIHETDGSIIWASPLAMWTKPDMTTYRLMQGDVPVNRVSEVLGMSGECLCGAFAKPGELDVLREHYPNVAAEIEDLEREVTATGCPAPHNQWGHGAYPQGKETAAASRAEHEAWQTGRLCTSCTMPDPLFALMEQKHTPKETP